MKNAMRPVRLLAVLAALAAAGGCKKKTETEAPSAGGGSADRDRLQGMWAIESLDDGDKSDPGRPGIKDDRLKFDGDKLTIVTGREDITFTFALDETKTPKEITLTEVLDGRPGRGSPTFRGTKRMAPEPPAEPDKQVWIYKFEGDALVLALTPGDPGSRPPPPVEFKGRVSKFVPGQPSVSGVVVITLKKTDTPAPPRPSSISATSRGTRK